MTAEDILAQLEALGTEQTRKTLMRHGAQEPVFGVRIGDMQPLRKKIGKNRHLALELFATGNYDAMSFAGLIADETAMTKKDLQSWVDRGTTQPLCEATVSQITAETPHARDLGLKWIRSKKESVASTGWSTLASWVSITDDSQLDLEELEQLVAHVEKTIHDQPNRVRYCMNGFLACIGCYVPDLTARVLKAARVIGKVEVDMGDTACKVPSVSDIIQKVKTRGALGKKRKQARC